MTETEKMVLAGKLRSVFELVSGNETHQRPELIDKANQILAALSKTMPRSDAARILSPIPHAVHPALASLNQDGDVRSNAQPEAS